jgi:CRP-like cAMP-binding protein
MFQDLFADLLAYGFLFQTITTDLVSGISDRLRQIFTSQYFRLLLLSIPPSIAIFSLLFKYMTHQFRITSLLIEKNFPSLSRKQIKLISKRIKRVVFPKGKAIILQGEQAKECFILSKGHAHVFANFAQVGQTKLADLNPGDLFGEMGLLEGRVRSATIIASDDCECFMIDATTFSEFISENSDDNGSHVALESIRKVALDRNKTNKAWLRFKD